MAAEIPRTQGNWRFSRLDGRFVFDYADGKHVGFYSDKWFDVDPFAAYVTALEADLALARAKAALCDDARPMVKLLRDDSVRDGDGFTAESLDKWLARYDALTAGLTTGQPEAPTR